MSKLSKIIALVLVVCFSATILSGCGSKSSGADMSKPVKLIYYTIGDKQKDSDLVIAQLNEYLKEKINATVEIKYIGFGDYTTKMNVVASSGENYDLAFTCGWAFNTNQAAQKGYLIPIDDLMDQYAMELKTIINPIFWQGTAINGKHFGVPCNKEVATEAVFAFNNDMVGKYAVDISTVKSLNDLAPIFAKVHAANPGLNLFAGDDHLYDYDFIVDKKIPGAIRVDNDSLKVVNQFADQKCIDVLKKQREYAKLGYISKDLLAKTENTDFNNRKLFCEGRDANPYADLQWSRDAGFPVVSVSEYPAVATSQTVSGSMVAISATSQNPERAMMFLNFLNTDQFVRNLINYGIEGVHYTKTAPNEIEFTKRHPDYAPPQFTLGNFFILYTVKGEPADKWEAYKKFNANVKKSPALGFNFNQEPVKNEIAALQNMADEYIRPLMLAAADVEPTLQQYMVKAKDAGVDKVLAEMQKQLDAWKATAKK